MIAVLQRVLSASVIADGVPSGKCGKGFLILLGVLKDETSSDALLLAEKISKLRVFSDGEGKMNLSVKDIEGGALVVSNFTLGANYSHGNRPDFFESAPPSVAEPLYEEFSSLLRERIGQVETGVFGADMQISLEADGPVTIVMDSEKLKKGKKL
jgi:D-tyrosyl-tRNA(Tyr) deacylase